MAHLGFLLDKALEKAFRRGGAIVIGPEVIDPTRLYYLNAAVLERLLKANATALAGVRCNSLVLRNLAFVGSLTIGQIGSEANPLPRLRFGGCAFEDHLDLRDGYIQGLAIRACTFVGDVRLARTHPSIKADRLVLLEKLIIEDARVSAGSSFDFSGSNLRGGADVQLLGVAPVSSLITDMGDAWPETARPRAFGTPLHSFSLKGAMVGGDLTFGSIHISCRPANAARTTQTIALNLERVTVAGSLLITQAANSEPSLCDGQINIRGGSIGGRLRFEGVRIIAPEQRRPDLPAPAALFARLVKVAGDFLLRPSPYDRIKRRPAAAAEDDVSKVRPWRSQPSHIHLLGQLDLSGAEIGGDLHLLGIFAARRRVRAIKAQRAMIKRNVRFGHEGRQQDHFFCRVHGECDFSGAVINGYVAFSGSQHTLTRNMPAAKTTRYKQGQAINLRDATIGRDVSFESSDRRQCRVEGLALIGATVGGRLLMGGTSIVARNTDGYQRKAITANGSTIKGGVLLTEDEYSKTRLTTIEGDVRLRNARVGGIFLLRGVEVICSKQPGAKGVAIWASNTRFGSDVIFKPCSRLHPTRIVGEIRFWGATIDGTLYAEGCRLLATAESGVALDCYTATIKGGVSITDATEMCLTPAPGSEQDPLFYGPTVRGWSSATIVGLISFNFARVQSLEIGRKSRSHSDRGANVVLTGALLLRDLQVQGMTVFDHLSVCPSEDIPDDIQHSPGSALKGVIADRLKEWQVHRRWSVVHANYANLGTRLFVRLTKDSRGIFSLYGATAGTIGAQTGRYGREYWSEPIRRTELSKEDWSTRRGRPLPERYAGQFLLVNLEEFSYKRLNDVSRRSSSSHSQEPGRSRTAHTPATARQRQLSGPPRSSSHPLILATLFLVRQISSHGRTSKNSRMLFAHYLLLRPTRLRYKQVWVNIGEWALGRPRPASLYPRFQWLQHQIENPDGPQQSVLSPYLQIAKVYREAGDLQRSYTYTRERRWIQMQNRDVRLIQRWIDGAFSTFFGFGYSPTRAFVSLLLLYVANVAFIIAALLGLPQYRDHQSAQDPVMSTGPAGALKVRQHPSFVDPLTLNLLNVNCVGSLCDYSPSRKFSGCQLPSGILNARGFPDADVLAEAFKTMNPFSKFGNASGCSLDEDASWPLKLSLGCLQVLSWIAFPLAAVTISGLAREKPEV